MNDYYRDTDERMRNDAEFRCAVDALVDMGRRFGFTPGELKQIAFAAALKIEETRAMPAWYRPQTVEKKP